ncbi:hypothetical protein AVEN_207688-1 [Araneus ventricosus]|uniref:SMB domain-containing protein n=1 Tax=Araneus ventricosus TaxID=182803 RepID=A0A4Y2SSW2_ARAVE|nr:hypothetical protein AVEN_207688-1 [Araneus ventricosus]
MKNRRLPVDVLFVVCVSIWSCIEALTYRDLEAIQFQNCPLKNRCSRIGNATFSERLCECDSPCRTFSDCCIDVARPNPRRTPRQTCMHYGNFTYQGVYVYNTCSNGYLGPDEVILQCMHDNFSDPLVSAPVTDTSSGETYLNRYCAICNGVSPSSMKTWKVYFACDDEDLEANDISWDDIKYNSDLKKWGYDRYEQFNPCKFIYDKPSSASVTGRSCRSNLISSCSSVWNRSIHRRECELYMAVVTDRANNAYKNPHCALCNGVEANALMCLLTNIIDRAKVPFSIALLVDVNRGDGDVVGVSRSSTESCPSGQKYDPFFKKCRTLQCGLPGYRPVNGKCVKQ